MQCPRFVIIGLLFYFASVSGRALSDICASTSERRLAKPVGRRGVATAAVRGGATAAAAPAAAAAAPQGQHAQEAARIKHPLPIQGPRSQEYVRGELIIHFYTRVRFLSWGFEKYYFPSDRILG